MSSSVLPRAVQYDDLTVVLKEAENKLRVMVEWTEEGWHKVEPAPTGAAERNRKRV